MRLMRPERSWRPIVTFKIDQHIEHETILGVDGQNINQKEVFSLCVSISYLLMLSWPTFLFFSDQATLSSVLQVNVWQCPQSKKKSRKRNPVASGSHCLEGLLKRQKHERSKVPFCHVLFNGSWGFWTQNLKSNFGVWVITNQFLVGVDLGTKQSCESSYSLHHIFRTLWRNRTARIRLEISVSHDVVALLPIA